MGSRRASGTWLIRAALASTIAVLVAHGVGDPARAGQLSQLPNIRPLPAQDVMIGNDDSGPGKVIRFSSWMANVGDNHFDIIGIPQLDLQVLAAASQCVKWMAPRVCAERRQIGTLEYHAAHQHWHFQDFARYELRRASDGALVQLSDKVSFCMQDSAPVRDNRGIDALQSYPLYYGCDLGTQGISAGWADIYTWDLAGQQLRLTDVPDGVYDIVIVADPSQLILESDDSDNTASRRIQISGNGTVVTVLD